MTDKVNISFKLSRFVDRLAGTEEEDEMTGKTGKKKGDGKATEEIPGAAKPSSSRQIMENFLQSAATPVKRPRQTNMTPEEERASKRTQQEEEEFESASEGEAEWQNELRRNILQEAGLTEEQAATVMNLVMQAFRLRVVQEAKKVATQIVLEDQDCRKSYNSIIIHKADQWVDKEAGPLYLNLAEKTTMAIHQLTGGSVAVLDAYTLGRWEVQNPPTAVMVTFGSRSQKTTFFKILAKRAMQDPKLKVISCRDAFPKRLVQSAKELAQKGNGLRTAGKIAAFRVVARGTGCLPVLETKGWVEEGRRELRWKVHMDEDGGQGGQGGLPQRDGGARTRRLLKAGAAPPTPIKPASLSARLSVSAAPMEDEDSEDTVFLPTSDEERRVEPY